MSEIIAFLPEHLVGFADIEGRLTLENAMREGEIHQKFGTCASIVSEGKIVACGGIHVYWKGMGEAWVSLRKDCASHHVLFATRMWLDSIIEKYCLDRVQAFSLIGEKWARTLKFFRFGLEAYLPKYGPDGVDKALWTRFR
jgi:hypothetical protein